MPLHRSITWQSSSIAEVNTAVSTLDRMTQENSAMVEQTTAAAVAPLQRCDTLDRSPEAVRA